MNDREVITIKEKSFSRSERRKMIQESLLRVIESKENVVSYDGLPACWMQTVALLLERKCFDDGHEDDERDTEEAKREDRKQNRWIEAVIKKTKRFSSNSKDISKIRSSCKIFIGIVQTFVRSIDQKARQICWSNLLEYLGHPFPKIRLLCAELVYVALMLWSSSVSETDPLFSQDLERAQNIVSDTQWFVSFSPFDLRSLSQLSLNDEKGHSR